MKGEQTDRYIHDITPKKTYKKYRIRDRRPFEIFWDEILIALFIIFMMLMLMVNYFSNQAYVPGEADQPKEVDVDVTIEQDMQPQPLQPSLPNPGQAIAV